MPTSVTGDSLVVTDADPDASSSIDAALVRRVAGDAGCVIVTWANDHYRDFARSWVGNLRALGLSNFMVGAMDADLHGFLRDEGVPTWLMGSRDIAIRGRSSATSGGARRRSTRWAGTRSV